VEATVTITVEVARAAPWTSWEVTLLITLSRDDLLYRAVLCLHTHRVSGVEIEDQIPGAAGRHRGVLPVPLGLTLQEV